MAFNVDKDNVRVRMAVFDKDIWPPPATQKKLPPDLSQRVGFSQFISSGRVNYTEIIKEINDSINRKFGTDMKPPSGKGDN